MRLGEGQAKDKGWGLQAAGPLEGIPVKKKGGRNERGGRREGREEEGSREPEPCGGQTGPSLTRLGVSLH